ncbi:MAG: PrgI family protein [Acutalibacteraceae bacterium]|nr:PrgI family protein [Acutalibacteraceae bacterium]
MSLEIKIPKEINKYEAKLIGPLTSRQTLWTVLGAGAAMLTNMVCKQIAPDWTIIAMVLVCTPFAAMGFVNVYDMPFGKFVIGFLKTNMMSPLKRKSIIKNQFALIDEEMNSLEHKNTKYKKSKKAFK